MPIDATMFRINFNRMFDETYLSNSIKSKDGIFRCALTWSEAKVKHNFLSCLILRLGTPSYKNKIIWFKNDDPYKGSKPFIIKWIGFESLGKEPPNLVLVVNGKKTDRIENKWTIKLSAFFGYKVHIIWEEEEVL